MPKPFAYGWCGFIFCRFQKYFGADFATRR